MDDHEPKAASRAERSAPSVASTVVLFAIAVAVPLGLARSVGFTPPPPFEGTSATSWRSAELPDGTTQEDGPRLQRLALSPALGLVVPGPGGGGGGRLWVSTDEGLRWRPQELGAGQAGAVSVAHGVGLVALGNGRIRRTTSSAEEWEEVRGPAGCTVPGAAGGCVTGFAWVDSSTVLAIGPALMLRSDDAGATWGPLQAPNELLLAVAFSEAARGVVVGAAGAVLLSENGGSSWRAVSSGSRAVLEDVAFADHDHVVAVGSHGTILRSSDGGLTWAPITSGTEQHIRGVAFADARRGVAVGFYGTVLRTEDGGGTWTPEASGTRAHLLDVSIAADGTPVVVGWLGTILRGPR